MENVTLKTRASEKIESWKKDVEQLKNQLQHNSEEAKESFEKQKAKLANWVNEIKGEIERVEGIGEEKAKDLKGNLEDLRVQAALGKMETRDALHDQQKKINHGIHNLKYSFSKVEKDVAGNAKALLEKSNQSLGRFQDKFEMYKLQLNDSKEGAIESWQERKDDLSLRLQKLSTKLESGKEDASERWEDFSKEMSEAWVHFRKALQS